MTYPKNLSPSKLSKLTNNTMSVYTYNGYKNRREYLNSLAEDYDVDRKTVHRMAELLGENEDFDGLITELEDFVSPLEDDGFEEF